MQFIAVDRSHWNPEVLLASYRGSLASLLRVMRKHTQWTTQ